MEYNYNFGTIIANLRKSKDITQEELAKELNISSQAISKWENGVCLPDTQMLPLLAKYFNVSIDYLFNGANSVKDKDIKEAAFEYIKSFGQFKGYNQALELFAYTCDGLFNNYLSIKGNNITHYSDKNGLALVALKQKYGVIMEKTMFEHISNETISFAKPILDSIQNEDKAKIIMAVISMDSVSFAELAEMTGFDNGKLRAVLDSLIENNIIEEEVSKHKSLGTVYHVNSMLHTGICVLLSTLEIMRQSTVYGISCCMGYGDYPINYKDTTKIKET